MNLLYLSVLLLISILTYVETKEEPSVYNITANYGPLNKSDYDRMHETFEQFESLIKIRESPNYLQLRNNHTDSLICKACLWTFTHVYNTIHKYYGRIGLFELLKFACRYFIGLTKTACNGYIDNYIPIILDSVIDHYLTAEFICTKSHMCKYDHFIILEGDDYAKRVLADKPEEIEIPKLDPTAETWRVLHVTDIHTDTKYMEGSRAVCPDPICCRSTSIDKEEFLVSSGELAGKWGFAGKCDLPLRTLLHFVDTIVNEIKPDFIIWTGDNPSHAEWETETQEEVFKITQLFTSLLKEKFNNTIPVYPSLGNHEKFPADQFFPYGGAIESPLIKFFAEQWKDWIGEEAYQQFIQSGFYTKKHLDTNLRIISYNCLFCDAMDFYLLKNPTDPSNQIEWLEKTLRQAESDNEVVYLIGHIPVGDTSLLSECAKRFKALADRFCHIIRGQFAGHTHFDEVKILHEYFNPDKISGVVFIAPSLTTHQYFYPSFRLFEIDSSSKLPKDYLQYRLNITEANSSPDDPRWKVAYRATEFFNVTYLNDFYKINDYVISIKTDREVFLKACKAFFADGPQIEMYCDNKTLPNYLSCRFKKDVFADFWECIGKKTWNSEDYTFSLLNYFGGKWYMRLPDQ